MMKLIAVVSLLILSAGAMAAPAKQKTAAPITIAVEGDVFKPGLYTVRGGANLKDVLALAGGLAIKPTSARVTIERGPAKKLSISASSLFQSGQKQTRQQPDLIVKLQDFDYIRVDTQPLNRPDPIMAFVAKQKAAAAAWPPESSSFQFNGITVYVIPVPGPDSAR